MKAHAGILTVLCVAVLAVVRARVVDPDLLQQLWERESAMDYYQKLQALSWDAKPYIEEDSPYSLHDVQQWPEARTRPLIGQVGGLATDSAGNVVVFHRADRRWGETSFILNRLNPALGPIQSDVIFTLSRATGKIIDHSGSGEFYMPHGMTIDDQDNMWLTDVGRHQIIKIPKDPSEQRLELGVKMEPGNDEKHFCKPTDVAVASNGFFFVADGYCNSRVIKFAPNGTFLKQWGKEALGFSAPAQDEFSIPHSLALDESRDRLYIADRENSRIQIFSAGLNGSEAGTFIASFRPGRGTIYAVEYDPNADVVYAVNGPGLGGIVEGFTLDMDGNILETWGPDNQEFDRPHDVTVSRDGRSVYVGDIGPQPKVYKFESAAGQSQTVG